MFSSVNNKDNFTNQIYCITKEIKSVKNRSSLSKLFIPDFYKIYSLNEKLFSLINDHKSKVTPEDCALLEKTLKVVERIRQDLLKSSKTVTPREVSECFQLCETSVKIAKTKLLKSALEEGNLNAVKEAIQLGANPLTHMSDTISPEFSSAIHYTLTLPIDQKTRIEILNYLLTLEGTLGVYHDQLSTHKKTPLEFLVSEDFPARIPLKERTELIQLFLYKGASLPLKVTPSWFDSLFRLGIDPEFVNAKGQNLLQMYLRHNHEYLPLSLKNVKHLIKSYPNLLYYKDNHGRLPLHQAMFFLVDPLFFKKSYPFEKLLHLLNASEKTLNTQDNNGFNAVHEVVLNIPHYYEKMHCNSKESLEATTQTIISHLELLVDRGAQVSLSDDQGRTPLYYAIDRCSEPLIRFQICQKLCELDHEKTLFPEEAFNLAIERGWKDISNIILSFYQTPDVEILGKHLKPQAENGDVDILALILDKIGEVYPDQLEESIEIVTKHLKKDFSHSLMDNKVGGQHAQYAKSKEEYSQNQKFYNRECYKAICQAAEHYFNETWCFDETIDFLAKSRHQIAQALEQFNRPSLAVVFGRNRQEATKLGTSFTPIEGKYAMYGKRIKNLDLTKNKKYLRNITTNENGKVSQATIIAYPIASKKYIPLTTLEPRIFQHTHPDYIPLILEEIKFLCDELKIEDFTDNIDHLCEKLGEIYWWKSHAMSSSRGSAAISDMFIKALFLGLGYQPVEWAEGMIPDCEALTTPNRYEFAKNFKNLLKEIPQPIAIAEKIASSQEVKELLLKEIADRSINERVKRTIFEFLEKFL